MREQIMEYAKRKYGKGIPSKVLKRLEYEFEKIESNDLANDLLVLAKIIRRLRNKGYFINVSGPLTNSVVAYLLGMLDINPMVLTNLLDLDFSKKQLEVIVTEEIHEEFIQSTKEEVKNIEIKPISWFRVELFRSLEYECNKSKYRIPLDDDEITTKAIRKEKIGTPLCYPIETYAPSAGFGVNDEKLTSINDYINYDNNVGGYSIYILIAYYISYYSIHFPEQFYQTYIECLMDILPDDRYLETREKMIILHDKIVDIYNKGYRLPYL